MNGVNTYEEFEKVPLHVCPICSLKLHYLFNFNFKDRLLKLIDFFKRYNLKKELDWHQNYFKSIEEYL